MADFKKTRNVLCLDGGGVRGLSTLIVLRKLLCLVNVELHDGKSGFDKIPLLPLEVFDVVVGTSTGGLIALMIVKLGMNVDKCIEAYKTLSREIFRRQHRASLLTFGFGRVKRYCGKRLKEVLVEKVIKPNLDLRTYQPENLTMGESSSHEDSECTVICRELDKVKKLPKNDPVCLCSHKRPRPDSICYSKIKVADAARATSAAPTYFSHVELAGKYLIDGGFGHTNNPSFAAWKHYFLLYEENYSKIQFVNIGSGAWSGNATSTKGAVQHIPFEFPKNLIQTLFGMEKITTDSTGPIDCMKALAKTSHTLTFDVFSANKGDIAAINLAEYKKLDHIEKLTEEYLEDPDVHDQLRRVARELADTYIERRTALSEDAKATIRRESKPVRPPSHNQQKDIINQHPAALSTETEADPGLTDTSSVASASTPVSSAVFPPGQVKVFRASISAPRCCSGVT